MAYRLKRRPCSVSTHFAITSLSMIVSFPCQTGSSQPSSSLLSFPTLSPIFIHSFFYLFFFPSLSHFYNLHTLYIIIIFLPLLLHPSSFFLSRPPFRSPLFLCFCHLLRRDIPSTIFSILVSSFFQYLPLLLFFSSLSSFLFPDSQLFILLSLDHQLTLTFATFQSLIVRRESKEKMYGYRRRKES